MKYRWLSLLVCGLSLFSCGMTEDEMEDTDRRTYIDFPDAKFEEYLLETYDLNSDGKFSVYEAQQIFIVDCSNRGIESLFGIEYFKRLKELYCAGNEILILDLDKNHYLEILDCTNNRISSLSLAKQHSLVELYAGHNQLSTLDLANTESLEVLDATYNNLELLDISNCSRLMKEVNVANNPLQTLYMLSTQRVDRLQAGSAEIVYR